MVKEASASVNSQVKLEKLSVLAGQTIFSQGEAGQAAYILEKGKVTIFQKLDGYTVELDSIAPGEIFGEMAVLDGATRMATAVAAEDCVVTRIPLALFQQKLDKTDKFVRGLINMFIKNIRGSHRIFLRRPRSFRDHLRQMAAFSWNIRRYSARLNDKPLVDDMLDAIERLDGALADLKRLAARCHDPRHDILSEDEVNGVDLSHVIGSEKVARITAAAATQR